VLTDAGEVAVERLQPGARVVSLLHRKLLPVAWIGFRRVRNAWPVRVAAGAFGPGQPRRALRLSPDHAVFVDGVLVPVRYLVNGVSIVQEHYGMVTYYHVELAEHGVLLAEGLPAESYLDTGNRSAFANGGVLVMKHPEFALSVWAKDACAPLTVSGPAVVAVRERLLARAQQLGWGTTELPEPHLLVGEQRIEPDTNENDTVTFSLPPDCREVQLASRSTVPAHLDPRASDHRRLGLAVAVLTLDGVEFPLNDARLGTGWHDPEPGLRWTDGAATLTVDGARLLTVRYAPLLRYWIQGEAEQGTTAG